ncbi:hypothetical protein [Micromonospora palomenae]|nr:hypothetical protein [Micromonospora palomenae]
MTMTDGRSTAKQVAGMGVWSLIFGFGDLLIQLWTDGHHPFQGKLSSWGLGEVFSMMGVALLCWAVWLRRQQR